MSRLTGSDVKSMMEAYNAVYAPQELTEEQVWVEVENWVNSLLEEGYDLSEYTWEEMYESYIEEVSIRDVTAGARQNLDRAATGAKNFYGAAFQGYLDQKTTSKNPLSRAANATSRGLRDIAGAGLQGYTGQKTTSTNPVSRAFNAATRGTRDAAAGFVTGKGSKPSEPTQTKIDKTKIASSGGLKLEATTIIAPRGQVLGTMEPGKPGTWKPSADKESLSKYKEKRGEDQLLKDKAKQRISQIEAEKQRLKKVGDNPETKAQIDARVASLNRGSNSTSARPAAAAPPTAKPPAAPKPAPAGQTGAKSLATAAAEKARIRGTSETDNPLMKNMRSRMSAPTSAQSPDVAKLGKGNQSLVNNPNVAKPTPSPDARAIAAKASVANVTAPSSSTPTPAAAPKPPTRQLSAADKRQGIKASYEYDAYDLVLEYLLAEGHADTLEEANYVMMEMDAEMVQDIVEQQTGAIRADVPRPEQRTVSMTATGKEPIGDKIVRQAGQSIGKFMGGINPNALKSTTVQPRKPLVSKPKPGTSK